MKGKGLIYFLLLLPATEVTAQDKVIFIAEANQPFQTVTAYLQLMEDENNALRIEDIAKEGKALFHPYHSNQDIDPYHAWWLKLEMSPSFSSDSFYIGLPRQHLSGISRGNDKADVWIVKDKVIIAHYETGTLTPLSRRPVANPFNRNFFPVSLHGGEALTIYWRLQRTVNFAPLQLNFALHHSSVISSAANSMDMLAWFYTGIMFILFMFGLVFFIITREKPFTWFTCIAATLGIHMQLLEPENSLTRWLFPEHPVLQFHLFGLLTSLFAIIILQFTRSFTETKRLLPGWDKLIVIVMIYTCIVTVASQLLLLISPASDRTIYFSLIAFIATIVIGVRLMLTKDLYARWAGLALGWLFVFQFLGILWNNDILPDSFPNPWAIAQIGMMIILFFALAYRFKQSAKLKAEAAKVLEMDKIKGRFFANISHEFRTPLTLLLGPLKLMEENPAAEPQRKYIRMMQRNGERLLQLINQLLDLSKLENGKMDLRVSKTDITALLKVIGASFESMAEQNQVHYHIHFPEENIIGLVDRDKLEKIVVNLLSNAFRFTLPNGSISFSVEHDEKRLRFTIQDSGVGMPKEQVEKIFDRFHQVPGTEGGTGIGLSLAKELLQLHKGQISVQSESGKGSSFRVSLPIAAEFYSLSEMVNEPASIYPVLNHSNGLMLVADEEEELPVDNSLPLVLIAEDNTDLQLYISDILKTKFRVEICSNGKVGLEKAKMLVPDCIVSDVMMPEMDGIELCKELKSEPVTSHIPVILLTAKAGSSSKIEGLQTGADDYLVKPFDGNELIIRIHNLIEQRKQLRDRYSKQVISIQPDALTVVSTEHVFIEQVRGSIEENIDNELFGVTELAAGVHLSRSQLHRKLKALTGQAPNELIRNYRLERALQLLQQLSGTITEIAFQTGFNSPAYFCKCFSDRYGYSPGEVKKKGS